MAEISAAVIGIYTDAVSRAEKSVVDLNRVTRNHITVLALMDNHQLQVRARAALAQIQRYDQTRRD